MLINYYLPIIRVSKPIPIGVQVLPVSYNYTSHGSLYIIGEVLNNTNNPVTLVKVVVNLFDPDGNFKGTDYSYLWPLDLPALEKGCFKISIDNVPQNWAYYEFQDLTYNTSPTSPSLSIITHNGSLEPDNSYKIIGQVKNNGNQRSNDVGVSGTLYNIPGVPVGCEYDYVESRDLNPGQVSSFQIDFISYYRDYHDVNSYKLRVSGNLP
jgi:hypothetical protein